MVKQLLKVKQPAGEDVLVTCPEEIAIEGLNERLNCWIDGQYHEAVFKHEIDAAYTAE